VEELIKTFKVKAIAKIAKLERMLKLLLLNPAPHALQAQSVQLKV